jgi:thiazole synthase
MTSTMTDSRQEHFELAGKRYRSRLILGSSHFPNPKMMVDALDASGAELVTVSVRRINVAQRETGSILDSIDPERYDLLPNTAGCFTAREAILTAELAREALEVNRVKVEVIGEEDTLLPDVEELVRACGELVKLGFDVFPYCTDDLVTCRKLEDIGCAAVMPLASPIGSGMGLANPYNFSLIRERISVPLIIDAGIGSPSDAALGMELGADAVLMNSAVSGSHHPVQMAKAMRLAIEAGRLGFVAGRIPKRRYARPSTPTTGKIQVGQTGDKEPSLTTGSSS